MNRFLTDENVKTLWDVVIDTDIIKTKPPQIKKQISELFINNIEDFYHNEKTKCSNLVEMNKKYIMYVLSSSSNMGIKRETNNSFIPPVQNVKQDMQNERQSRIDKDFERRQKEFESTMKLDVPPSPNFNDKLDDGPIKNIEEVLREMAAQRKYDVYNITNNQSQNINTNWLKPEETSIKNEKEMQKKVAEDSFQEIFNTKKNNNITSQQPTSQQPTQEMKYIKIENQELDNSIINNHIIDLNNIPKKQVSWGSNETHNITDNMSFSDEQKENNLLFSKLKRKNIEPEESNIEYNINYKNDNDDNNYNYTNNNGSKMNTFQNQINKLNDKIDKIEKNINTILQLLMKNNL